MSLILECVKSLICPSSVRIRDGTRETARLGRRAVSAGCSLRENPGGARNGSGQAFFICWPQQISTWGMSPGQGQATSYTIFAPHFSQT